MAFQGSLRELPLPDIIQLVAVARKSGVFSIEEKGNRGKIFLRDGQIVHAEVGALRGEEAVYELSIWPEGHFQFDPDDSTHTQSPTIDKSNTNLLLEAARRMDEWRILSRKVPSTRMVPMFTAAGRDGGISFNPRESEVARRVDDRRTIEAIALDLGESPFDIAKVIYGLVTSGMVKLRDEASWLDADNLGRLSSEQLAALASTLCEETLELLRGDASLAEVDRLYESFKKNPQTATVELAGLVRRARQLIAAELGPDQAMDFFDRVEELIEAV